MPQKIDCRNRMKFSKCHSGDAFSCIPLRMASEVLPLCLIHLCLMNRGFPHRLVCHLGVHWAWEGQLPWPENRNCQTLLWPRVPHWAAWKCKPKNSSDVDEAGGRPVQLGMPNAQISICIRPSQLISWINWPQKPQCSPLRGLTC